MSEEPELKPCPNCGHNGDGIEYARKDETGLWTVECLLCGHTTSDQRSMKDAQLDWNKRENRR